MKCYLQIEFAEGDYEITYITSFTKKDLLVLKNSWKWKCNSVSDKPSHYTFVKGIGFYVKCWRNFGGLTHRINGPAAVYSNRQDYYLNDIKLSKKEWEVKKLDWL